MKKWIAASCVGLLALALAGCGDSVAPEKSTTPEPASAPEKTVETSTTDPVKYLQENGFSKVEAHKQEMIDGKPATRTAYLYDAEFKSDTTWGSAQDFNGLTGSLAPRVQKLFATYPEAERMLVHVKNSSGQNWVNVQVRRTDLPKDFADTTYLHASSFFDFEPGAIGVKESLCAFWIKYPSARPEGRGKATECASQ